MKKAISALTALVLTFTVFMGAIPVGAEETRSDGQTSLENDISVTGTNSFGNLLSDELSGKMDEQQQNNGCNIFSAEVTGNEAIVSFETIESATLLVAVYDEAGEQMLASGHEEVPQGETEKTVTIETDSMPEYFYLRAFLVDTNTLRPICTAYQSPNYTREMQEFFAKTVDDFDSEKVLNLDENKSNNFAVYGEGTRICLDSMGNDPNPISSGTKGTVQFIDDMGAVFCKFDNGKSFGMIPGEDSLHKIQEEVQTEEISEEHEINMTM